MAVRRIASALQREKKYVHMLNGTLCATERALCCLVETHQTPDGINIPEVCLVLTVVFEIIVLVTQYLLARPPSLLL